MNRPSYCITGNHPTRAVVSDDLLEPGYAVSFPCGFEPLVVHVYGNGLCEADCCEAAVEYIRNINPKWSDDWERSEEDASCTALAAIRERYMIGFMTGPDLFSGSLFVLQVSPELVAKAEALRTMVQTYKGRTGDRIDVTLRSGIYFEIIDALPDLNHVSDESTYEEKVMRNWLDELDPSGSPVWVPDDINPDDLVGYCKRVTTCSDGIQLWENDIRLTCYPKHWDGNARLESEHTLQHLLFKK